jgi:CoA:oxalate CoA-transferase
MKLLKSEGFWAAPVYNWDELMDQEGFAALDLLQETVYPDGALYQTTRCPIRIDGEVLKSSTPAPVLGTDTRRIGEEFGL